jgi:putative Holliday junction resolvase
VTTPFPEQGRIVGIDYGDVRVGIALSDPQQKWASPLEQYHRRTPALDAQYFAALKQREGVLGWVVGLPVMPNGTDSAKSVQVRKFG